LIGEQFEDADEVCGVLFHSRKADSNRDNRIQLWTKNAQNREAILRIGEDIRKVVDAPVNIAYEPHSELDSTCQYYAFAGKEIRFGSAPRQ
jgi:hypothetical protein